MNNQSADDNIRAYYRRLTKNNPVADIIRLRQQQEIDTLLKEIKELKDKTKALQIQLDRAKEEIIVNKRND